MSYFVGIDIGGTTCTVSIGNTKREVIHLSGQFPTNSQSGPQATIEAIRENVLSAIKCVGIMSGQIQAIGLATPGPATIDGVLLRTPNLDPQQWDQYPIREAVQTELQRTGMNAQVGYLGDGQAAALGEYVIRSGQLTCSSLNSSNASIEGSSSIFMVIVGTGLGGGEVQSGDVIRGSFGRAGHVGHTVLPEYAFRYPHDRQLIVGNAYCTAESAISLTGLTHQLEYRLTLDHWQDHPFHQQPGPTRDKAKRLRELAANGDELALQLFDDQARALGITFLNVNYLGDYDVIVIGGGVCDLAPHVRDRYLAAVKEAYHTFAQAGFRTFSRFEYSVCGDEAPVIGALAHAFHS